MASRRQPPPSSLEARANPTARWFPLGLGCFLGLALIKFGNPVILGHLVAWPGSVLEWLVNPWPLAAGYALAAGLGLWLVAAGLRCEHVPRWVFWLPLPWFGWQLLAGVTTVDPSLTLRVLPHFAVCVALFYAGLAGQGAARGVGSFWGPIAAALAWVFLVGFEQHYGGLEATRRMVYEQEGWENLPSDYLKRLAGGRVFATLFYPNTLAGVIILLLPAATVGVWQATERYSRNVTAACLGTLVYAGLACLYWSASKAGWLIIATMGGVAFLAWSRLSRAVRYGSAVGLIMMAVVVFGWRFQGYFERGATSARARLDYWRVAAAVIIDNPIVGSGPGTFSRPYSQLKRPSAEMTRLVHNDYLEQGSDSGLPGLLAYAGLILGSLVFLTRRACGNPLAFAIWLGLAGWAIQSLVEFGLYVPAVAWPAFTLLGCLWGWHYRLDSPAAFR